MLKWIKSGWAGLAMAAALSGSLAVADTPAIPLPAEAPQPSAPLAAASPAIWTIAKPDGRTITLFGSVHLLPAALEWKTPALAAALAEAEIVTFETPIEGMTAAENMAYLQSQIMNPPGVTLSALLSAEQKASVEAAAKTVGVPLTMMEAMRPWFVAAQMGVLLAVNKGYDPNSGVDKKVEAEARALGKMLGYFETAREQIDLFATMKTDEEVAFLAITARDIIERPDDIDLMVEAWRTGDVAGMEETINGGLEDLPGVAKALLHDRNARWVETIAGQFMNDGQDHLIVVGAGHLAGPQGVPALLRARGFVVSGP